MQQILVQTDLINVILNQQTGEEQKEKSIFLNYSSKSVDRRPQERHSLLKLLNDSVHKCKRALHGTGSNQVGKPPIKTSFDVVYVQKPDGSMTIRENDKSELGELLSSQLHDDLNQIDDLY